MNKIIIMGFLGKDPEIRYTQAGKKLIAFTVAVNKHTKQGEPANVTWYSCSIWGEHQFAETYLKKGSSVIVTGTLEPPRIYQNKDGVSAVALSITVHHVEFSPRKDEAYAPQQGSPYSPKVSKSSNDLKWNDDGNDELPF